MHVSFFSHLSILSLLCNPSPLLPRYHFSSPCKLSCSEPQRTLLSVELRILSFFNMLASVPSFFKALSFLHFMPFFQTFSCVFLRLFKSFLPAISSFPQQFPQFSLVFPSLPLFFSSSLMFFSQFSSIFLHFLQPFATPSSVSLLIPLQTVLLRTPMDAALR